MKIPDASLVGPDLDRAPADQATVEDTGAATVLAGQDRIREPHRQYLTHGRRKHQRRPTLGQSDLIPVDPLFKCAVRKQKWHGVESTS